MKKLILVMSLCCGFVLAEEAPPQRPPPLSQDQIKLQEHRLRAEIELTLAESKLSKDIVRVKSLLDILEVDLVRVVGKRTLLEKANDEIKSSGAFGPPMQEPMEKNK